MRISWLFAMGILCGGTAWGATVSPLAAAGYSVLPTPQRVTLSGTEFTLNSTWRLQLDAGVAGSNSAVETLNEELVSRHGLRLSTAGNVASNAIVLSIKAGAVDVGAAQDRAKEILAKEAYRIELSGKEIRITANADAGLFYGVETLVQLLKRRNGELWLPAGEIVDWPDLQLRAMYWDDAHHLERMDALKKAIRNAAYFKMNGFVLKLDGHFQFKSAPALVEPYALSPEEYQALTDYGQRYHVQVIPYLDAPAHIAFILKHPEYAGIRAFPGSNYELNMLNPESYKLLLGMYQDLLDANKGGNYFYLSTDEPYYVGLSEDPKYSEAARAKELGSPGKLLAEFMTKAAGYLHERGRTVVFWGEYPAKPADVPAFPKYLVSGSTNGPEFDTAFKAHGIRQMFFTSCEGEERLFPDYALAPGNQVLHSRENGEERVADAMRSIRSETTRRNSDLMGSVVAGWADSGLHPETFWLGYAAISAAAWNPNGADAAEASADFYRQFHGASAQQMDRVYRLLSTQAQFWSDSWERMPSTSRKGIWGSSHAIFETRHSAHDETLPLPRVPADHSLESDSEWLKNNARRLELAEQYSVENDELCGLLQENLRRVEFNHYNLEVFLSLATLCRQNIDMILGVGRMHALMASAKKAADEKAFEKVLTDLDKALEIALEIRQQRNAVLKDTTETWYKSWFPRVASANGRTFLHEVDDVKDHLPDRTVGMEYLVLRELLLPFGEWVGEIQAARNAVAKKHQLPVRDEVFEWKRN